MKGDTLNNAEWRFKNFLSETFKQKCVWGLKNNVGLATWKYEENIEAIVPFWSDEKSAQVCAESDFPGYTPFKIALDAFVAHYLPALEKQKIRAGVNFTTGMTGIDMPAVELSRKIKEASGPSA